MKSLHPSAKILFAAMTAIGFCAVAAQALPPIGKEIKLDPKVKVAVEDETLKHGMRLVVNLKDKNRVVGTLVYADEAGGYLMVRPRPGALPQKIMDKDIAGIDRIRLTNSAGDVVPDQPEIHQVSVINGSLAKVQFFAPTISSSERARLADLEIAQNEMSRAEQMMTYLMLSLRDELQALREDLQFQDRRNKLLDQQLMYAMYPSVGYFNPLWGYGYFAGWGGGYPGYYAQFANGGGVANRSTVSNAGKIFEALLTKEVTLGRHVAEARRTLTAAQNFARYEGDRLVAVIPETTTTSIRPAVEK